jgi:polyphosphate kinase 2 (PPK2 family)
MVKDKQNKHAAAAARAAPGKMRRKELERELGKLQVELTRLQTWVKHNGAGS